MSRGDPCDLCGNDRPGEVRDSWARWSDARPGHEYTALPRCADRAACRSRVEANGDCWDVVDGRMPA